MKISVILCTYNRCHSLAKALESAAALKLPNTVEWEVFVIDNNSSDQTRQVVEDFCRRFPGRFRYLFEPRQGKSHALNTGIQEVPGDILAFMDDDVVVDTMWLQNLTAALDDEAWQGAGGRIFPDQDFSPPRWLPIEERYAMSPLAMFDPANDGSELTEPPFGTNMAFRKAMFQKYGGFRTDLGPQPGSMIRNEDTEFGRRLLAAGERLRYEPSAIVYHPVSKDRIQKQYFLSWWFDKGRADVREFGSPSRAVCLYGIPLCLFRRLAMLTLRWMATVAPSRRFKHKIKVWLLAGQIVEFYHQAAGLRDHP
jgi:glucosyl-dolichyl phosphate glucuronosyltransferase